MIINQLELVNFGIYYGKNNFEFTIKKQNNIVLIGGENGAGKTTILEAIKLVLYGPLMMGFKTNTERYLKYIKEKINYTALKEEKNQEMSIQLDIDINKQGDIFNYNITRCWNISNLVETLIIKKNHQLLNDNDAEIFMNYIRTLYSPSLFDFFLFNGEKINNTIYDDYFQVIFGEIASNIFNLTIPKTLREDIKYIQNENLSNISRSSIEENYFSTQKQLDQANIKLKELKINISNIEKCIQNYKNELSALKESFNIYGGLFNQEIQQIKHKINNLEEQKKDYYNTLKYFYQTFLPFTISKDILSKVEKQIKKENDYRIYQNIKDKLKREITATLDNKIRPNYQIRDIENRYDKKDEVLEEIISSINRSIVPDFDVISFDPIHQLSAIQETNLINHIRDINNIDTDNIKNKLKEIYETNMKLKNLNNKLKNNDNDPELKKHCQK